MSRSLSRVLAAAGLLLSAGPVLAQGTPSPKGGTLHAIVAPEPPSLMVGLFQNGPTQTVAGNIYESLLRYDAKLEPQPSLAERWEVSSDQKTYTFHLRRNAKWHDGKPFSADDVVFSLEVFHRSTHPRVRPILNAQVEKIEKVDDHQVRIVLKQPFAPLLTIFEPGSATMVPKHIYEGTDYRANPMNNTPIGTGPMKLKEWRKGSFIHLVRNEDYYLPGKPALAETYFRIVPDAAARAVAYEKGEVDVLTGGSVEVFDIPRLAKLPNTCVERKGWEMFAPVGMVIMNLRNGPLANKEFRQGLMHAIDREFSRDVVWSGYARVATGPLNASTKFYTDDVRKYPYDLKKAKELIAKSGYKGEPLRLLPLPYGETWTRWGEQIKQNLEEAGVKIQAETTDVAGWNKRMGEWDFDLAFNYPYQYGDPALGVARQYISSNIVKGSPFVNNGGYSNPEVDRLFAEAANAPAEKRPELYKKVQQILVEDVPILWLTDMEFPMVHRCNVKDLATTAIGMNDALRDARKE
ncbi:ABC transporter substrate-binding protein [Enterovirga aerilata]|uniref:ABC transporter substrate-binding protein n=1 Tax=Enterovirga aerilata TaxID=2730920 RepID=A0A849IFJ4_9HYPH|nr:ABC transporter substrate-binding protein [Enterovirga sp. DB1703]NNM74995.1 ABC transporter substrate-binding protein [Enterovirga sp. DB1703]